MCTTTPSRVPSSAARGHGVSATESVSHHVDCSEQRDSGAEAERVAAIAVRWMRSREGS